MVNILQMTGSCGNTKGLSPSLNILPKKVASLEPLLETKYWPIGVILSSISYVLIFSALQEQITVTGAALTGADLIKI